MKIILYLIFYFVMQYTECNTNVHAMLRKLSNTQKLITADIDMIKQEVWIEMASQIQVLSEKLATQDQKMTSEVQALTEKLALHDQQLQSCSCLNTANSKKSRPVAGEISNNSTRYTILVEAFKAEKIRTVTNERKIKELNSTVTGVKNAQNEMTEICTELPVSFHSAEERLNKNENDIESINGSVTNLAQSLHEIEKRLKQQNLENPSFVSEWTLMKSQDAKLSELSIVHGLGTIPYKVRVQIKPTSGPNAGWIFNGDSAFQSDDDSGRTYGGIVYLYNERLVRLFAPKKNNNGATGSVIHTGEEDSRRIGDNHQTSGEALVRVQVWGPKDIITPDFKSDWLKLDVTNRSLSFNDIQHGINGYPALVNVQIRCKTSDQYLISEGVGSSMFHRNYLNGGGVTWGYNDKSVRVWTSYFNKTQINDGKVTYHRLFGSNDGWGMQFYEYLAAKNGKVRVLVWSQDSLAAKTTIFKGTLNILNFSNNKPTLNSDLISLYVQADDGPNKGYRFPGYGNSQSIFEPFGGVVYAYNKAGVIRTWRPNPSRNGHLVHIHSPYGAGTNVQASNNASCVVIVLDPSSN